MDLRDAVLLELDNLKGGCLEDHPIKRLRSLFAGNWELDIPDVAVLLRQILMAKSYFESNKAVAFVYDKKTTVDLNWRIYGLEEVTGDGGVVLRLMHPNQSHLRCNYDWFEYKEERKSRQRDKDPFFYEESYKHEGQREALNILVNMLDGATSIIQLPTGSGKSALFTLPLFLSGTNKDLSIVVVPTVSLALDQARRLQEDKRIPGSLAHPLAWHAELSNDEKEEIKNRIKEGRQRIVFLNPETLFLSLMTPVVDAAKRGSLKYLFVDEAHLIGEWGEQFRPEFQGLGSIKNLLIKYQPALKTVLLSATINKETREILGDIFSSGVGDRVNFGSFNFMREEPKYYCYEVEENNKNKTLLEVFRHTPRPAIFYATFIKDVEKLHRTLTEKYGHSSIAKMTGKTQSRERQRILQNWSEGKIDVVVANTAFGVGLDKSNVRAVVHFSVPETFDRYYQEVGRSGRDGFSSYAIAIFSQKDIDDAKKMLRDSTMGKDLAWERWKNLIETSKEMTGDNGQTRRLLNMASVPPRKSQESEFNMNWNYHVVRILGRCKILKQHIMLPSDFKNLDDFGKTDPEAFWEVYNAHRLYEITSARYMNEEYIKSLYNNEDPKLRNSKKHSQKLLVDVFNKKIPTSRALETIYKIDDHLVFKYEGSLKPRNDEYQALYKRSSNGYLFYDDKIMHYFGSSFENIIKSCEISKIYMSTKLENHIATAIKNILKSWKRSAIFIDVVNLDDPLDQEKLMFHGTQEKLPHLIIFEKNRATLPDFFLGDSPAITLMHKNIKCGTVDRKLTLTLPKIFSLEDYLKEKSQ